MALADKLVMSDETAKGLVKGIKVGGFWGRVGVYLMLGVPIALVLVFIVSIDSSPRHIPFTGSEGLNLLIAVFVPAFFFIIAELGVRSWRRKNGLNVYGNIAEELRQREVDVQVAREEKARGKMGGVGSVKDLDYWFGMLEKGAITKEEYEKKKMELL